MSEAFVYDSKEKFESTGEARFKIGGADAVIKRHRDKLAIGIINMGRNEGESHDAHNLSTNDLKRIAKLMGDYIERPLSDNFQGKKFTATVAASDHSEFGTVASYNGGAVISTNDGKDMSDYPEIFDLAKNAAKEAELIIQRRKTATAIYEIKLDKTLASATSMAM